MDISSINSPRLVCNDFDPFLSAEDELGDKPFNLCGSVVDFQNFIFGLIDLGFHDNCFTQGSK